MAGEWIRVTTNLHVKPEVLRMARILGIGPDETVGKLVRFWCWADSVTVDGHVDGVESRDVDAIVSLDGFYCAMEEVGWVKPGEMTGEFVICNFDRHNGESSKKRGLKNERQARWRAKKVVASVDGVASTKASTREEKRREDITPIAPDDSTNRPSQRVSWSPDGDGFNVPQKIFDGWVKAYPALSVESELAKAHVWALANPKNRKSNWGRFLNSWLQRAQDKAPRVKSTERRLAL